MCRLLGKKTKLYFPNQEGLPKERPEEFVQMDADLDGLRDKASL
jgi:hypothetical protein